MVEHRSQDRRPRVRSPPRPTPCSLDNMFHQGLSPGSQNTWRMPKELHCIPRDHPRRFDSSPCRRPDGKPPMQMGGGGTPTVSSPLSPSPKTLANVGGTTVSRVRIPPLMSCLRVAQLVEHDRFVKPLLPGPTQTGGMPAGLHLLNVHVSPNPCPPPYPGCRRVTPRPPRQNWKVAQLAEQRFLVPQVAGSIPALPARRYEGRQAPPGPKQAL